MTRRLNGGLLNREKTAFRRDTLRLGAPLVEARALPKSPPFEHASVAPQGTVVGAVAG